MDREQKLMIRSNPRLLSISDQGSTEDASETVLAEKSLMTKPE